MQKLPTLKTPRLILRPFKMSDSAKVAEMANHKEIATNTQNLPFPYEQHMALDWIRAHPHMYEDDHMLTLAVVSRKKGIVMGAIGLEIDSTNNNAELGYWLGTDYWGQGFATEAAKRIVYYGFNDLNYHRIHSIHLSQNPASGNVLKKIGMTHEGTYRQHILKWGEYLDAELYGILKDEFKSSI